MIPPDEFIEHAENCLKLIKSTIEEEAGRSKRKKAESDHDLSHCLMTLNF
jgi:hypothetical protein